MDAAWLFLGLTPLLAASWLGAKHGFRVEPGPPRLLAAAILAWGWVTVGMEALGSVGRLDPPALVAWSVGGLALAGAVAFGRPSGADVRSTRPPVGIAATLATALVLWAGLRLGLVSALHPVKVVSDGPIYHLYMAARWWKAGRLFLVATPFGEQGATYFWANGELWYAWLMTLSGGDRAARLGQVPFLALGGLAVAAIARQLAVRPDAARLAACWFVAITPQFIFGFEPNVDAMLVAGYLLGACFFLRAFASAGDPGIGNLILGSLAAGLGMGTKPTGIVFFPPVLVLVVAGLAWRSRGGPRRAALGMLAAVAPAAATMGYWPIRNAMLTGNPLYPIQVAGLGRVWLAGWFGPAAMRFSPYYVPLRDWRAGADLLLSVCDPRLFPFWLAAALGCWAIRRPATGRDPAADRWVGAIAALAWLDLAAYWLVIPYRTQQRFAFPALGLMAIPLARLFDRAGWLRGLAVGLLALHIATPQPWPIAGRDADIPWDGSASIPNAVPAPVDLPVTAAGWAGQLGRPSLRATGLVGVGVVGLLGLGRLRRGIGRAWLVGCVLGAAELLGARAGTTFPPFADYYNGWTVLESLVGRQGARVAYAGNKIPYYLMGSRLQNDVRYVNIDAHPGWLLHDYHRHAPAVGEPTTWPNPFPAWGRLRPDYDAWLANLRAERIDLLVVMRVNIAEGIENAADAERFPIERAWAEAHPGSFRPLYGVLEGDPQFRIYQVLPPR